ncbi:MAG: hypothetical protein ACXWU5_10825 [Rhodoplanes sp.]|jgi:hypothetical protein
MTINTLLEELIKHAETWPQEDQEEFAVYAREIEARRTGLFVMSDDERAAANEGLVQADGDVFVPDERLAEADKRHRR